MLGRFERYGYGLGFGAGACRELVPLRVLRNLWANVETLQCSYGSADPVLHRMTEMILPWLNAPTRFSELFLDRYCLLLCNARDESVWLVDGSDKSLPGQSRALAKPACDGASGRMSGWFAKAQDSGGGMRAFDKPFRTIIPSSLWRIGTPIPDLEAHRKGRSAVSTSMCALSERCCKRVFSTKLHSVEPSKLLWELLLGSGGEKPVIGIFSYRAGPVGPSSAVGWF